MQSLSERTSRFGGSMIRAMTQSAHADRAINLGQGFPDFDPPAEMMLELARVSREGPHQYAQTSGAANLRIALSGKLAASLGRNIDPDNEVVITCGGTEAMMATLLALVDPGDRVAVFSPYYENYVSQAIMAGAVIDFVPLSWPDFRIDFDRLEQALAKRPKALIVCNPSNPTGKVFSLDELTTIANLADRYDVYVVTDEVYEHIVFDGRKHIHAAGLPGMSERVITTGSLSKTYAITGWRLGYVYATPRIIDAVKHIHDYLTVCAPAPVQEAVIAGLRLPESYYENLRRSYQKKRDLFARGLVDIGLEVTNPQGAYYVLMDTRSFGMEDDLAFCRWLIDEIGVIAVPGTSFQQAKSTGTVRLHFAKREETLLAALNRLEKIRTIKGARV